MTNLRKLLAANIKNYRRKLGLTQSKLAEKADTATHYIAMIEGGKNFPSPEMMERIAAALEIDSLQLFSAEPFPAEAIKQFQEGVLSDLETAVTSAIGARLSELKKMV